MRFLRLCPLCLGVLLSLQLYAQVAELATEARQFARARQARIAGRIDPEAAPRLTFSALGEIRHVAAAPGFHFPAEAGFEGQPVETARRFLLNNRRLFGIQSPNIDVVLFRGRVRNLRPRVRLAQTYGGIPFFAAQAAVQIGQNGGIEAVLADLSRDVSDLDAGRLATIPTITSDAAIARLREVATTEAPGRALTFSPPQLTLFDPRVLDVDGKIRLVWDITVRPDQGQTFNQRILLDAHTGEFVRRYPNIRTALNRKIYDMENDSKYPGDKIRDEGDPASGQVSVDNAYNYAGDTYNYYLNNHGRDGLDNSGRKIEISVRACIDGSPCPWANASWLNGEEAVVFGSGWVSDDVVGHELTHGVTFYESGLIYENTSGAIDESLSDIFGEFIDLTNGDGNDSASVRWFVAEDITPGTIRNMQNPPAFNHPDMVSSSFYVPAVNNPNSNNDSGGVHTNSGVNNKLAYLLTDGDTFNGETIYGLGIPRASDLYYEANADLLTPGADWTDLFNALLQAAVNLGWSASDQNNLYRACVAVQIATGWNNVHVDLTKSCLIPLGEISCGSIVGGPFPNVRFGLIAAHAGDTLKIHGGTYNEASSSASIVFDKIMEIRAYEGPVTIK